MAATADLASYYKDHQFEFGFASLCHMGIPNDLAGKTVLDIGCRRGKGVVKFSERVGATGKAIGIDWSPEYIDICLEYMDGAWQRNGLPENNMQFILGYPEALDEYGIEDNSIDFIYLNSSLWLMADPWKVLAQVARVLKPGGMLSAEVVLANAERDQQVVEAARKIGNSIQSAPFIDEFMTYMRGLGFNEPDVREHMPVPPHLGYKQGYEVEVIPNDELAIFEATVIYFTKAN